ncbi:MAG: hypothetical protein WD135_03120 [Ferruginibacter sp.]
MFTQTWKKYLPVITLLLKKTNGEQQMLAMNHTDFERAAGGRKIKFSFSDLELNKGRINSLTKHAPLAKELATVLQEDNNASKLLTAGHYTFSMNNDFKLLINHKIVEIIIEMEAPSEDVIIAE